MHRAVCAEQHVQSSIIEWREGGGRGEGEEGGERGRGEREGREGGGGRGEGEEGGKGEGQGVDLGGGGEREGWSGERGGQGCLCESHLSPSELLYAHSQFPSKKS